MDCKTSNDIYFFLRPWGKFLEQVLSLFLSFSDFLVGVTEEYILPLIRNIFHSMSVLSYCKTRLAMILHEEFRGCCNYPGLKVLWWLLALCIWLLYQAKAPRKSLQNKVLSIMKLLKAESTLLHEVYFQLAVCLKPEAKPMEQLINDKFWWGSWLPIWHVDEEEICHTDWYISGALRCCSREVESKCPTKYCERLVIH